ncbi:MAG: hypothetical protein QG640_524 [Patescibacteria group bacterium]|nr:hypothetical protein [Patescibacteria group bacterium]
MKNSPLTKKEFKEFCTTKPVVGYSEHHERFVGVAESIEVEGEEEVKSFTVHFEWAIKTRLAPRVMNGAEVVAGGKVEVRSVRFVLPIFVSYDNDILLIKCMDGKKVSLTNLAEERLDALRLKEQ